MFEIYLAAVFNKYYRGENTQRLRGIATQLKGRISIIVAKII